MAAALPALHTHQNQMRKSIRLWSAVAGVLTLGACGAGAIGYFHGRPAPVPAREHLFTGVEYMRRVQLQPRPMVIHTITIDMRTGGLHFLVTPPDERGSS